MKKKTNVFNKENNCEEAVSRIVRRKERIFSGERMCKRTRIA